MGVLEEALQGSKAKWEMVDQVVCVCHSFKEVKVDFKGSTV